MFRTPDNFLSVDVRRTFAWGARLAAIVMVFFCLMAVTALSANANTIFWEGFNGYASNPGFPGSSNDLGGHRTIYGVPTQAGGADSNLWMAARFEAFDSDPLTSDVGVLRYGSGSSGGTYGNPAGRVDDDAGLVIRLDLTNYQLAQLAFDWRTFNTESTDRFVVAYYVGDGLGTPNNAYDWFNDPTKGASDMTATDPNGQANTWYVNNWTEVHRGTSPNSFQQESGILLPVGDVIYLAFWLDNGDHDLAKVDNIHIEGVLVPEPSSMLIAGIGVALYAVVGYRHRRAGLQVVAG